MPVYNFRNKQTQEVIEKVMKIAEKESFLEQNNDWESVILTPTAMSYAGTPRVDSGFKEVISKIKERTGQSIGSQYF